MNRVDFFSFHDAPDTLRDEWNTEILKVIRSGQFIGGPFVNRFEVDWANYLGIKHAIGVGNGYDALLVALRILGIGKGDLVAVPSHTFVATWLAVGAVGATPVGIDCNISGLMNVELLESSRVKFSAVIPVHMHGQMVDMPRLVAWAKENAVLVIEDCAQAHGARVEGKSAGTWGEFGAFSFYPTKNLGALGDAGCLVTNDSTLASRARSYVNYGSVPGNKYQYQFNGINSRLDPMQAAVLSVNLKYLDDWNSRRNEIAKIYTKHFREIGVKTLKVESDSVFHHFIVESKNRDQSRANLESMRIKTEIHYPECAEVSYSKFTNNYEIGEVSNASNLASRTLSLPISPWMPDADVYRVLDAVTEDNTLRSFLGEI
jgi:dTDP-4-amino-4,6-dideoxygalactose transaminase